MLDVNIRRFNGMYISFMINNAFHKIIFFKLLQLPQPHLRAHICTDKSKRPESHSTKECARVCVLCLMTEPKYYYCPITLVMT
jgi:hypothetical protein